MYFTGKYNLVVRCKNCGEIISSTKIITDKIPHEPGEAVKENEVAATHKQKGSYDSVVYCENCKKEISCEQITVEKKAHTYVIDKAVAPTYSKKGKTEGAHCSQCKTVLVVQKTIPKLEKKNATIKVKKKTFKYKAAKVKKANQTFYIGATVTGNGKITYTKISGSSRLKVTKAGKITVKKGTKKGTYRLRVNIKAASSKKYKAKTKKFTITVKIR